MKNSIEDRLLAAQVAINNALADAGILSALSVFGYNESVLNTGKALYDELVDLVNSQKVEYGEQFEASAELRTAWDVADAAYMISLKVARVAFRHDAKARAALMLAGDRKQSLSGWLQQASAFYANLLSEADLLTAMTQFGYDQAKLEAEQTLVEAVAAANLKQEKEKGEAQDATQERDAKLDELTTWMADFRAIARVALEGHPQWLEKLGFGAVA